MIESIQKEKDRKAVWIIYILMCFFVSRILLYIVCFNGYGLSGFINNQSRYDAGWYQVIAEQMVNINLGESSRGQASWVFFPLYPMVVRGFKTITGLDTIFAGTIVSCICFLISEFYAFLYVKETRTDILPAYIYTFIMSFGPYTFYFMTLYSEAMYLMFLTMAAYYLHRKQYIKMGIVGVFLSLTRNTGVMFVFVVAVFVINDYISSNRQKKSIVGLIKDTLCNETLVLGTMMIPLGLFSYMYVLYKYIGDGFAFVHGQVAWWRQNVGIITNFTQEFFNSFPPGFLSVMFLIFVCIIMSILVHKRYAEAVMPIVVVLLSATSSLGSVPRYMMGSFFCILEMADYVSHKRKTYIVVFLLIVALFGISFEGAWRDSSGLLL